MNSRIYKTCALLAGAALLATSLSACSESEKPGETRALVQTEDGWGYIDETGEMVIPAEYHRAGYFSEGLAPAGYVDGYGYINAAGEVVIPFEYDEAYVFSEGLAGVQNADYLFGFINKDGEMVIEPKYRDVRPFKDGFAAVLTEDHVWGFINTEGEEVVKPQYDFVSFFNEGLAAVRNDEMWGYIDVEGNTVIPHEYKRAKHFSEGLAPVETENDWGYIDVTGKMVIADHHLYAEVFNGGMGPVELRESADMLDPSGNKLWGSETVYTYGAFVNDVAAMDTPEGWGHVDRDGNPLYTQRYSEVGPFNIGLAMFVADDEMLGFINREDEEVVKAQFVYNTYTPALMLDSNRNNVALFPVIMCNY